MKKLIDNFSKQSTTYKKYRPEYPADLYDVILNVCQERNECWDCGTGNGQVAKELSKYFKKVSATDISENQLKLAEKRANIDYRVVRSESTDFEENQFDLITVAQAVHWFDFQSFYREVRRVGKAGGIICIWGYGLLKIEKGLDEVISKFYREIIGPYWNEERKHIDAEYKTIEFDFKELENPKDLFIQATWSYHQLIGYLNSWSSVQNYIKENGGENPVEVIAEEISQIWKEGEVKQVRFPVFMKMGLIEK